MNLISWMSPPYRVSQLEDHLRRQALILENARAAFLIAAPDTAWAAHWLRNRIVGLRRISTVPELSRARAEVAIAAKEPLVE